MSRPASALDLLLALREPRGPESRRLRIGDRSFGIEGLDADLAGRLDLRWGGFVDAGRAADVRVRVLRGGDFPWVPRWSAGERYRVEGAVESGRIVARSYAFAVCPEESGPAWRIALADRIEEVAERVVENAVRFVVARDVLDRGGLALHAAAVERGGRAWVFAGPSRAGKSTAVRHSAPARSLGDDFVAIERGDRGWVVPATPFDNLERGDPRPPRERFPLAGIWRLIQDREDRVEEIAGPVAVASLLGTAAFAWAMPDRGGAILDRSRAIVADRLFANLRLRLGSGFWSVLDPPSAS